MEWIPIKNINRKTLAQMGKVLVGNADEGWIGLMRLTHPTFESGCRWEVEMDGPRYPREPSTITITHFCPLPIPAPTWKLFDIESDASYRERIGLSAPDDISKESKKNIAILTGVALDAIGETFDVKRKRRGIE